MTSKQKKRAKGTWYLTRVSFPSETNLLMLQFLVTPPPDRRKKDVQEICQVTRESSFLCFTERMIKSGRHMTSRRNSMDMNGGGMQNESDKAGEEDTSCTIEAKNPSRMYIRARAHPPRNPEKKFSTTNHLQCQTRETIANFSKKYVIQVRSVSHPRVHA